MVALGGHAWLLLGGMRGCSGGACVVFSGGHVWFFLGGACIGYDEIPSMNGWYTSYWNAFLFITENTCYVLCNFSSVEFGEFNDKIKIGKTQYRAPTQLDGQVQYLPFMA